MFASGLSRFVHEKKKSGSMESRKCVNKLRVLPGASCAFEEGAIADTRQGIWAGTPRTRNNRGVVPWPLRSIGNLRLGSANRGGPSIFGKPPPNNPTSPSKDQTSNDYSELSALLYATRQAVA